MARRRSRKTARKIQPVERKLTFQLASGANFVDLGFALSRLNRKSFRQGYEYVIEKIEVWSETGEVLVGINRLSSSWVIANAWVKAFHAWKDQQKEWEEDIGSDDFEAKYNDFKIFLNHSHATDVNAPMLPLNLPDLATAQVIDPDVNSQWIYSQFVVPNDGAPGVTNEYQGIMCGPDIATFKGLVHNYALSRSRPQVYDPNQVAPSTDGGLFQDMEDVGENLEEVGQNVRVNNFATPYLNSDFSAFEWYPGGAYSEAAGLTLQDNLILRVGTSAFGSDSTGPFSALCGLLLLNYTGTSDNVICQITVAPGSYKGVMARRIQDVN